MDNLPGGETETLISTLGGPKRRTQTGIGMKLKKVFTDMNITYMMLLTS